MEHLHEKKLKFLELVANDLRKDVIQMLVAAKSGHSAGPLGMADIFAALYFHILRHDPKNPAWKYRDRVVLSNGHICPILYATLARSGYFDMKELLTLRKTGTRLQGHPHRGSVPGVETTSGPLGSGLSQAAGMALAARMDGEKHRIFCLLSDGEHQEGNLWEAIMFIGKNKLSNITAIIDRNNIQIDGNTENVMPLEPLGAKYESFGWHVLEISGHDFSQIVSAVAVAHATYEKPTVIIAHTIPGKGVGFMENDYRWHGIPPGIQNVPGDPKKEDQAKIALSELRTMGERIESEHQ